MFLFVFLKTTFEDVFPAEATTVEEYLQQVLEFFIFVFITSRKSVLSFIFQFNFFITLININLKFYSYVNLECSSCVCMVLGRMVVGHIEDAFAYLWFSCLIFVKFTDQFFHSI